MNEVLNYICQKHIERELNENVVAVSVPEIAENLNYSVNFVRKHIRRLMELDLIVSVCESGFNEYKDRYEIVRGYKLTDKGKNTDEYEKCLYELTEQ